MKKEPYKWKSSRMKVRILARNDECIVKKLIII